MTPSGLFFFDALRCVPESKLNVADGSNASVELSWHAGFTPDFGRMVATQELTLRARSDH
jgi:hypothetical protein